MGRHLLTLGIAPGLAMGALIDKAFQAQLDGAFQDESGALQWTHQRLGATD
jgi:tRNA nucleotidyltransferase (CCA-adding enzyme)